MNENNGVRIIFSIPILLKNNSDPIISKI